jgi:hypothetical protein
MALGEGAETAYPSMLRLLRVPGAVDFIRVRLSLPPPREVELLRLIAELDADDFRVREQATRALEERIYEAASHLRAAVEDNPSPEVLCRARRLLAELDGPLPVGTQASLRRHRAIALLEWIGTSRAARVLADLAELSPSLRERRQAAAALTRLGH